LDKNKQHLSDLTIGQSATITGFNDPVLSLKLMEMGCLPGEVVSVELFAPMGDPMMIAVAGYHLSLRKEEAASILVELNPSVGS